MGGRETQWAQFPLNDYRGRSLQGRQVKASETRLICGDPDDESVANGQLPALPLRSIARQQRSSGLPEHSQPETAGCDGFIEESTVRYTVTRYRHTVQAQPCPAPR